MCSVVIGQGPAAHRPVCLVLVTAQNYADNRKTKDWFFRFNLSGTLEKAVSGVGENDKDGKPVEGSAVDSPQDIKDPDVQERAQQELKFWLERGRALAKKESAVKATGASPAAGAKAKKSGDQAILDDLH